MLPRVPLGISDFRSLRERGLTFIDKSLLIRDCLQDTADSLLLPRPRRFGKTLGLSMLRCFLERSDTPLGHLFDGLAIAGDTECRAHFQRYPTVALTFKDVKARSWTDCRAAMAGVIADACREHRYLLADRGLDEEEAADFQALLSRQADNALLWRSLRTLSMHLARHHKERVVILIDEYDTPIHAAFLAGYYDEAIEFFRNFLSGGLKDNPHLFKGVMTGVLRVAKDSVFTGLNNLEVYSLLRPEYASHFGFTEPEVQNLLDQAGCRELLPLVQRWYNGYVFGGQVIYNPWSVLSFVKSQDREPRPYWGETSSNDLVKELLIDQGLGLGEEMERLLRGEALVRPIVEHVALRDVREQPELVWSLLLHTGYLKVTEQRREGRTLYGTLALPNQEVQAIYETLLLAWVQKGLGGERAREQLVRALLGGDAEACERLLGRWLLHTVSFHDTAQPAERFYHGFVLGLLVSLGERYEVVSNREAGHGRCDVMLVPRSGGLPGVVLELKVAEGGGEEQLERATQDALAQLGARDYAATLRARGAAPIQQLAVAFSGKQVRVRRG